MRTRRARTSPYEMMDDADSVKWRARIEASDAQSVAPLLPRAVLNRVISRCVRSTRHYVRSPGKQAKS
jgi:hypothetical protein